MGAQAPVQPWIPEDDLLLKNAVEAGASLESLARGAVRFSRKFTIHELQDRWHSILFDKDVSEKVSDQITEIDPSVSNNPKFSKACSYQKQEAYSAKRKTGSLRNLYNGMRKRVCNVPLDHMAFDFDMLPGNCLIMQNGHCELNSSGQPFGYYLPDGEISADYHIQEGKNIEDGSPEVVGFDHDFANVDGTYCTFSMNNMNTFATCVDGASHVFHTDPMDSLQSRVADDTLCEDNLSENPNEVPSMSCKNDTKQTTDHCHEKMMGAEGVHIFENQLNTSQGYTGVHETEEFTGINFCEDCIENKHWSTPDPMNDAHGNICSECKEHQDIKSDSFNCSDSFPQVAYSPPSSGMPIWDIVDGIPSYITSSLKDKISLSEFSSLVPIEDAKGTVKPKGDSDPKVINSFERNAVTVTGPEDDFLSVPLDVAGDGDALFVDKDERYIADKFCIESLNNFLMSPPADFSHDDKTITISHECNLSSGGSKDAGQQVPCAQDNGDFGTAPNSPDMSSRRLSSTKHFEEFVFCVLNTEDPDIPCNEHIFPTVMVGSTEMSSGPEETSVGQSLESLMDEGRTNVPSISRKKEESTDPPVSSSLNMQTAISEAGEESRAATLSCIDLSGNCKQELGMPCNTQVCLPSQVESDCKEIELLNTLQTSHQEEKYSDNDHDAPSFSDIEALILEMDLDSDDQESPIYTREVSRYQQIDTRKTVIRLEQCALSCMQRAISSHGAFAIFYGRYLKYYIKKTKVLLGRASRDSDVDIDLRKEFSTNKISRHQAIIEMDGDGSFSIKNMGKCPISINGKELLRGNHSSLCSGCLIKFKGMAFIFEVNSKCVRKYLSSVSSKKSQVGNSNFDWTPGEVT